MIRRVAQAVDPDAARADARAILDDRRFRNDPAPRPFRGPLRWLGDRLDPVVRWIGDVIDFVPWYVWLAIVLVITGLVVAWIVRRVQPARRARSSRTAADRAAGAEDPAVLEREADAAERRGDLERAVRLRFRAGLLRLGDRGAVDYRPSLTTSEVRARPRLRHLRPPGRHLRARRVRRPARRAARRRRGAHRVAARRSKQGARGDDAIARRATVATVVIVAVLLVVVANVVAWALDHAVGGNQPGGKSGSSYATSGDGLAAYAQLLADYGYPVRRIRGDLAQADIDPGSTLIVTGGNGDAFLAAGDVDSVTRFVALGGRAVLVDLPARDLRSIAGIDPTVVDGVRDYHDFAESLGPLRTVRTDAAAAYAAGRDLTPLASEGDRVLLGGTQAASGDGGGEMELLADGSPIENAPDRRSRQRGVRPRARGRGRHARRVRRRRARVRRVTRAGCDPRALEGRALRSRCRGDRVRMGTRPPPRTSRSTDAHAATGAVGLRRSDGEHARTHL